MSTLPKAKKSPAPDLEKPSVEKRPVGGNTVQPPGIGSAFDFQPDLENPDLDNPDVDNPDMDNPILGDPDMGFPRVGKPNLENRGQLSTNVSITDAAITYQSNPYQSNLEDTDRIDVDDCRQQIRERISYHNLILQYDQERLDEIVEIMVEVLCGQRYTFRIAGAEYPAELVKNRIGAINDIHIQYIFDCLDKTSGKIGNIKKYLLSTIFNAPVTMDSYYTAEVAHDMAIH